MAASLGEAVLTLSTDNKPLESGLNKAKRTVESFAQVGGAALLGVSAAVLGVGAAVGAVGFDFNSMKQQSTIAFTTMLGSGEKAKVFLDDLQDFASKTPFEFPELVSASQRLLAMGFSADKVRPTLTAIGDAVAGLGGNSELVGRVTTALGQMQAKGKASAEELGQLTEAGIPAWEMLAKKIGVSIPEAMKRVSAGSVDAGTAIDALTEGMSQKFGGMMEAQSRTMGGLMSTLKDTAVQMAGEVTAPLFDLASGGLAGLTDWLASPAVTQGIKTFSEGFGAVLTLFSTTDLSKATDAFAVLSKIFGPDMAQRVLMISQVVMGLFGILTGNKDALLQVQGALTGLFGPEVTQAVLGVAAGISGAFDTITSAIAPFVTQSDLVVAGILAISTIILAAAIPAMLSLAATMLPIVAVIAGITAAVVLGRLAWENNFLGIRDIVATVWSTVGPILAELAAWLGEKMPPFLSALGDAFGAVFGLIGDIIGAWWRTNEPFLSAAAEWLGEKIPAALAIMADFFKAKFDLITGILKGIPGFIAPIRDALNGINRAMPAGGGDVGIPIGEGQAKGGDVLRGVAYPVGERGPELFVPKVNGTIVPNDKLGEYAAQGGPQVVNHWNVTVADGMDVEALAYRVNQEQQTRRGAF